VTRDRDRDDLGDGQDLVPVRPQLTQPGPDRLGPRHHVRVVPDRGPTQLGASAMYWASQRRESHGMAGTRLAHRACAAPSSRAKRASRGTGQSKPPGPATSASHSSTPPSGRRLAGSPGLRGGGTWPDEGTTDVRVRRRAGPASTRNQSKHESGHFMITKGFVSQETQKSSRSWENSGFAGPTGLGWPGHRTVRCGAAKAAATGPSGPTGAGRPRARQVNAAARLCHRDARRIMA
jgi:hypothetical protein